MDGLFIPNNLLPDAEIFTHFLGVVSCPVWIVKQDAENHEMAILIDDLSKEKSFIDYTVSLASRLQHSLTGLIQNSENSLSHVSNLEMKWFSLTDFSSREITLALQRLDVNLLFIRENNASIIENLPINCVVYPD